MTWKNRAIVRENCINDEEEQKSRIIVGGFYQWCNRWLLNNRCQSLADGGGFGGEKKARRCVEEAWRNQASEDYFQRRTTATIAESRLHWIHLEKDRTHLSQRNRKVCSQISLFRHSLDGQPLCVWMSKTGMPLQSWWILWTSLWCYWQDGPSDVVDMIRYDTAFVRKKKVEILTLTPSQNFSLLFILVKKKN